MRAQAIILCLTFTGILLALVFFERLPSPILWIYLGSGFITLFIYVKDKRAAESGGWRTPEMTLHLLSLAGGWPIAGIAQSYLRHKTQKTSFRVVYWITVAANCLLLIWLLTPQGAELLGTTPSPLF